MFGASVKGFVPDNRSFAAPSGRPGLASVVFVLTLLALGGVPLNGAESAARSRAAPAFNSLRYDDDFRVMQDPAARAGWWDALKHLPLSEPAEAYLSLGGEARWRYEYYHNSQWGAGPQDENGYFLQRYMLHGDAHLGEHLRIFSQVKSGLEEGREGGPRPTDRDDLDLHQLFFDIRQSFEEASSATLRVGRQELAYGSSRLISVRESPNVRLAFDGAKGILKLGDIQVDGFWARPVETDPGLFDDERVSDSALWGVYGVLPIPRVKGARLDLYYLGLERDEARFDQGTARELRHTVGTRLWGRGSGWDYNFELVYQFGTFGGGDIAAWTVASDTGYTFANAPWRPRVSLRADVTSGDRDPDERDLQTFNPLFPRGAYFGETSLVGPANHMDVHPSIQASVTERISWTVDWDLFWRQSDGDGIYGNAVNLVRSGRGGESRFLGSQVQTMLEWRVHRHLSVTAVYAHFFAAGFLSESGASEDVDYASVWATVRF